jgi:GTP-binding protein
MDKPIVAIVGRQNVGKSTLLNCLLGKRQAIVADKAGTTRDRIIADVTFQDSEFMLVDTGGLMSGAQSAIIQRVEEQVKAVVAESDLIIFLVDARDGLTVSDREIAAWLRPMSKPVILVANKVDNSGLLANVGEFYKLGMGEPAAISAYHRRGTLDLLDNIVSLLPPSLPPKDETEAMKVAIVGRPNVGKSMLLNALLGKERAIVNSEPGTTRDAIDTLFDFQGRDVLLIDTAGVRRRGRITGGVEHYSVLRSLRAIERSDVALLVIDAMESVTAQDMHIAGFIEQAAKGVVLVVNKWDLVGSEKAAKTAEYSSYIRSHYKFLSYASLLYVSAKLKWGLSATLSEAWSVYQERRKQLPDAHVSEVIKQAVEAHSPPRVAGKELRIFQVRQTGINPPSFVFRVNKTGLVHFSYRRYLENRLRQAFGFAGTPLRLVFKVGG